eukprot:Protomagalhaensia_wolfi_Nauph_80__1127@NODE_1663_length_1411_cov_17_206268_g1289_i0_p1_GENE_NODE_1663_length_1411_cov_17_206268_g1289_i0NODE_1663_length_1411_cov_17_206268_g1289_i0_p1_ORF_typecomplete_len420_score98_22DUF3223/PF11523_8/1_8e16La/PF05383_17/9_4e15_NODE_1663_length_1411_cov_17_206268_g1289_i0821341
MAEGVKRELVAESAATEPEPKRPRVEGEGPVLEVDLAKVRRQVEYYLSDENLRHDKFFHEIISADASRWLPVEKILTCRRIQALGAKLEHLESALKESETVETGQLESGAVAVRRKSDAPLPVLEERPPRRNTRDNQRPMAKLADAHVGGCIVKLSGVPAEAGWESLKQKLTAQLPRGDIEQKAGDRTYIDRAVQYVSPPDAACACYAVMGKFENDQVFFRNGCSFEVNGAQINVSLVTDMGEINAFLKQLPASIRRRREKDLAKHKTEMARKPILLGGIEWQDIDHLRESLKGVLKSTSPGAPVNAKTKNVLIELLKYHPNGASKLADCVDFKVDIMTKEKDQGKDITKCFWVVRKDNTCEDFSMQKCLVFLSANPPFVEKQAEAAPQPAAAPPASEDSGATKTEVTDENAGPAETTA